MRPRSRIRQGRLTRDIALESPRESWRLLPATLEAMQRLAELQVVVLVYGSSEDTDREGATAEDEGMRLLGAQIEAAGGRVDGFITCTHPPDTPCRCWGDFPGLLWAPALRFGFELEGCYVLGDSEIDAITAEAAGSRPLLVLCDRPIEEVVGANPRHGVFVVALHLSDAVTHVLTEKRFTRHLERARRKHLGVPVRQVLQAVERSLPTVAATSTLAIRLQERANEARTMAQDIARWLSLLLVGTVGLSLGIAYLVTHLYRQQPFPAFMFFFALYIPPRVRGILFIILGTAMSSMVVRSFVRSTGGLRRSRP